MTRSGTGVAEEAGLRIRVLDGAAVALPGDGRSAPDAYRLTGRTGGAYLLVGVRGSGVPLVERMPDVSLRPGDICFYDANHPPVPDLPERCRLKVFLVPHEELGLEDDDLRRVVATPVARSSRLGTLLSPFLSELADTVVSAEPPVGEMLARNAVNLLATLATERSGRVVTDAPGTRSPMVARVLRFIDEHLADADLSPEVIAGAHHISVRYLHKLFRDEGTTVGRWIQRRRLEECRRDLVLGLRNRRTIASVAGRWGFLSATHFSRVFRAAYGMSPSEWRDTAGRPGGRT
ncbi:MULTISPECIES: helix-turn-helix domain-containing protein [Streptomyces]|uniref:AraC-like DNA-binding protein n=1 Tax=Streptomyces stelliscabiei TaxID=146820 RepID=A0A8I0TX28_9ACTN|nr:MULTISPECIES: helix-turn-helix domain-containing protein [Streptomyces]MBE1600968.1 AraC-like DNA-binding protein [Streptomyces stelliscabiei]MDX2518514.1 helix-turn-helix domain-containing protein [Streptomyces stelliscabiei]MDX2551777.1 helix-turn-helix domain-containing protein [Streptomyces stelliscabiei]MDX2614451.1 helix-turn-helix domain-containing protein [Streptomyces stelliscabiei]MDX2636161.1 helix-turn-helix domain-containing protein [Streptomyces stelliscabiei]